MPLIIELFGNSAIDFGLPLRERRGGGMADGDVRMMMLVVVGAAATTTTMKISISTMTVRLDDW
jgi:hypothetical protein